MNFSGEILAKLGEAAVIRSADELELHAIGSELLEVGIAGAQTGPRLLLTRDAAIDLAFRLADFLARIEANEERQKRERSA